MNLFARAGLLSGLVLLTPLGCNPGGRPDLSAGVRHILNNNILNNNIFNNNILNNNLLTNDYFNFRAARAAFFQAPAVPASTRTINLLSVDDSTHTVAGTDISFSGVSTFDLINLWTKSAFCMGPSGQPYSIQVDGVERNTTTGAFGLASLAIADDDMVDLFLACTGAHANIESVAISINGHHRDGSQWTVVTPTEDEAIAFPRPEAFFTAHRDSSSGDIHWYITLRLTDLEQMYMNEMMRYYTLRVDPSITPHLLRTCADAILRRRTDPSVVIPLECGGDKLIERNGLLVRASGGPNPYSSSEHFCE
ncbi:MAG TPA: hypothetical protein VKN99_06780, partial [Polyangia bacterium]|nr:hypothetical protein [Polyangia bacterium]